MIQKAREGQTSNQSKLKMANSTASLQMSTAANSTDKFVSFGKPGTPTPENQLLLDGKTGKSETQSILQKMG